MIWLRRLLHGSQTCACPWCPHRRTKRGLRLSKWCDDHTDAIIAGPPYFGEHDAWRREVAVRLGARRWALRAEVDATLELGSAEVLASILEMSAFQRAQPMNRSCWDHGAIKLAERVDELTELGLAPPLPRCPDGSWHRDGSRHCRLTMYHRGPHEYEVRDLVNAADHQVR